MKRLAGLCVCALFVLVAASAGAAPAGATELGGNYNQYLCDMYNGLVTKSGVKWVRAFVSVPRNFLAYDDPSDPNLVTGVQTSNLTQKSDPISGESEQLGIATATKLQQLQHTGAKGEPAKVILNLKLDMKFRPDPSKPGTGIPVPGTPVFGFWVQAISEFLTQHDLGASVDVLVLGNEPMFEVPDDPISAGQYQTFLEALIPEVAALRNQELDFQIFLGALDKPSSSATSPILNAVVGMVNTNPTVDGLDLHLHEDSVAAIKTDLDFVRTTKHVTKTLSVTEFSLVGLWNQHANDPLSTGRVPRGFAPDLTIAEWLNALITRASDGDPVPAGDLSGFFNSLSWYPKKWFNTFMTQFEAHDVMLATYGLSAAPNVPGDGPQCAPSGLIPIESNHQMKPDAFLWVLDFVYNGALLGQAGDGFYVKNPLVAGDFAKWVKAKGPGPTAAATDTTDPDSSATTSPASPSTSSTTTTARPAAPSTTVSSATATTGPSTTTTKPPPTSTTTSTTTTSTTTTR